MSVYDTLNKEQKEAVLQTEGPLLLLAGAGSGKTRVLTHRIAYLIENCGVNPWNILAITFTNKAAGEMRERVDSLVGFGSEQVWVATFHATCVRILRRYIDLIGYTNHFTIYDADDQKSLMKDVCKRLDIDTKELKEKTILNEISSCKDELIGPDEFEKNCMGDFSKKKIVMAYHEYQKSLKKNNALDFDDIIVKTIELFKTHPEVLNQYQERFRYIMVDEYQDTNTAQFELIRLLADKYRNLCVVGDDDQSIYKFRGANIHNILDFEKVYKEAKVIKLEQNYRSTRNILDAANAVIKNNTARKEKSLWTENEVGNRIHFRQFDTAYEEAEYILYDILERKRHEGCRYGDNAILYRTNAQSRLLEEQFVKKSVPYEIVGSINFYARKEIKDILAYLKTIDNAVDDLQVKRIINIPRRGIGATTIAKVQKFADENSMSFYDALEISDRIPGMTRVLAKVEPFVTMIRAFRGKMEVYSLKDLVEDILDCTHYIDDLKENDPDKADERIENIDEFITKVVSYEESADEPTLNGFLEEVALVADIDKVDENTDKVLLMTMHAAKGLEFDYVYLAGMEDGIFPSNMSLMDIDPTAVEEERRLAYVGITRAKKELTVSCAACRMIHGETEYHPVSRFVREIPENLMDNRPVKPRQREFDSFSGNGAGWNGSGETGGYRRQTEIFSTLGNGIGVTRTANAVQARPKARTAARVTPLENKPFITKGMPSVPGELSYGVGDRVKHVKFGEGVVTAIEKKPRDFQVTINFDTAGQKIMYAAFARLKKIGS